MPAHTHTYTFKNQAMGEGTRYGQWIDERTANTGSTGGSSAHTHSMTDVSSGVTNSLPPYYALAYIIRIM